MKRTTDFLTEYSLAYDSDRDTLWFSNSTNMHTSLVGPQVSRLSLLSSVHSTLFVATAADFNDVRNDVIRSVSRSRELVNIDKVST